MDRVVEQLLMVDSLVVVLLEQMVVHLVMSIIGVVEVDQPHIILD